MTEHPAGPNSTTLVAPDRTPDPATSLTGTFVRVPGVRLLGRYEGSGYADPRYLVVRPDGQTVMLTRLLYLAVQYADDRLDPAAQATLISREYGRLLPVEHLARLVRGRLAPAGLVAAAGEGAQGVTDGSATTGSATTGSATTGSATADAAARSRPLLSVTLKGPLIPVWVVRRIARGLSPLFHPAAIVAVLLAFVAGDVWLLGGPGAGRIELTGPGDILAVTVLMFASVLVHEFGHAAGCHYGGGRPGAIGAGLYLWMPVLWTEVTDAYRLDRRGRLRTDLGGLHFSALVVVVTTAAYAATGWPPFAAVAILNNIFIPEQLVPFVRLDGYYLLGDLTGVPNLFGLVRPVLRGLLPGRRPDPRVDGLRRGTRVVVTVWVLVTVLALSASLVLLVLRTPALVLSTVRQVGAVWTSAADPSDLPVMLVAWLSIVVLLLPFVGCAALLVRAARLAVRRGPARPAPDPAPPSSSSEAIVAEPGTTDSAVNSHPLGGWLRSRPPAADGADNADAADGDGSRSEPDPDPRPDQRPEPGPEPGSEPEAARQPVEQPAPAPVDPPPLTAASFTEELMLRARRTPPQGGLRRAVFRATGGRFDPGPSAADRRRDELVARIRRPVRTCRRVVVLSRKGGAGKTTTTLMLGHVLAMNRGDRVVALDANPDAGSLPYRVAREGSASLTTLLNDVDRLTSYAEVRAHTSQAPTRLEIVASDDDPRITKAMGRHDYKRAIELLDRHFMIVLLDTGTGILDDAIQGILAEADQLVVVMPPALDGARVAASTLDWLGEHGYTGLVRGAVAVVNGIRGDGGLVQIDQIERHFAARCSAVVRIPWDRSLEAGGRTGPEDLARRTLDAYLELAACVADGFEMPGRRR